MLQYLFRFLVGGTIVFLFACLGDLLKPKSFAGLFGAAPSVALATLGLTIVADGKAYAALESRSMILGAASFFVYTALCTWLMLRKKTKSMPRLRQSAVALGARALFLRWQQMNISFNRGALAKTKWYEYLVRFAFGGAITVTAGILAKYFGSAFGGPFLAFPAIFPASATLVAKHETQKKKKAGIATSSRGRQAAALDAAGAALGRVALAGFALTV